MFCAVHTGFGCFLKNVTQLSDIQLLIATAVSFGSLLLGCSLQCISASGKKKIKETAEQKTT